MASRSGPEDVAIVVEAFGVLQTRDGFDVPAEVIEERARAAVMALRGSYAIVRLGPNGFGEALAHMDAASSILVAMERKVSDAA